MDRNLAAFRWGRAWAADPAGVERTAGLSEPSAAAAPSGTLPEGLVKRVAGFTPSLQDEIRMRTEDLCAYQSASYAERYLAVLEKTSAAEQRFRPGSVVLTDAVARNLHKLMAYKDEYEVARLLVSDSARADAEAVAGPGARVVWHLHPPMLRSLGMKRKLKMGPWARPVIAALARGKKVRGTPLDLFGYAAVRRTERRMVKEYEAAVNTILGKLTGANFDAAVEIAGLPDHVRGYEALKMRRAEVYRADLASRLAAL